MITYAHLPSCQELMKKIICTIIVQVLCAADFYFKRPMFEKYPSISPYTYCANNPMILWIQRRDYYQADEDGRIINDR